MRTLADTFWSFATRTTLYRIWAPLHDDGGVPLFSIWIDPALTAFQACARMAATANSLEGHEKDSTNRFGAEDLSSILLRCN
jgi:hypothetical protein